MVPLVRSHRVHHTRNLRDRWCLPVRAGLNDNRVTRLLGYYVPAVHHLGLGEGHARLHALLHWVHHGRTGGVSVVTVVALTFLHAWVLAEPWQFKHRFVPREGTTKNDCAVGECDQDPEEDRDYQLSGQRYC